MAKRDGSAVTTTSNNTSGYVYVMPRICRHCKHWDNYSKADWGECLAIGYGGEKASIDASHCEDGPELDTREDFGCVLWEDKNVQA